MVFMKYLLSVSAQAAITECHGLVAYMRNLLLTVLEVGKSNIRVSARSVSF